MLISIRQNHSKQINQREPGHAKAKRLSPSRPLSFAHLPNWSLHADADQIHRFGHALWAPVNLGVRLLMNNQRVVAKKIADAIRQVLINDWDPIGVMSDPHWPRDEYDSYIGQIHGFLERGESAEFLARHLCFIEDKLIGLGAPPVDARMNTALKLKMIDVHLSTD
ncbi:MAG: hypothetical protein EOP50_02275 [Sphingobacteriales bacterium]|nr:MAG: hypothetical protein EOP50_02275 [Sphingobacteriales bacterium]